MLANITEVIIISVGIVVLGAIGGVVVVCLAMLENLITCHRRTARIVMLSILGIYAAIWVAGFLHLMVTGHPVVI